MAVRPMSFLSQAAAQRAAARENEAQRNWQKEQSLRDFGMNIGQSLIASLGNFGAQAGADAIRFNREEPERLMQQGALGAGTWQSDVPAPAPATPPPSTGATDILTRAALQRVGPGPEMAFDRRGIETAPAAAPPAPKPGMATVAGAKNMELLDKVVSKPLVPAVRRGGEGEMTRRAPMALSGVTAPAPAASPMAGRAMREVPEVREAPSVAPEPVSGGASMQASASASGPAGDTGSWAQQQIRNIAQKYLGGGRYVGPDGKPLDAKQSAMQRASDAVGDLRTVEMLAKLGLVDAEMANSVAAQIQAQGRADAAMMTAESDRQVKIAQSNKLMGEGAQALTGRYGRNGRIMQDAPRELEITAMPGEFPTARTIDDRPVPARGGGGGGVRGGGPIQDSFTLNKYQVGKGGAGKALAATEVPLTVEGLRRVASEGTGGVSAWLLPTDTRQAISSLVDLAEQEPDEAVRRGLLKEAAAVASAAQGKKLPGYAGVVESKSVSEGDIAEEERRKREAAAKLAASNAELLQKQKVARAAALQAALAAKVPGKDAGEAALEGLSKGDKKKVKAYATSGGAVPSTYTARVNAYKEALEAAGSAKAAAIDTARTKFMAAGGSEEEWNKAMGDVGAPGPAETSPGQPPAPGDESKLDLLFNEIEAQPWSAARKRRVFMQRARAMGLG